MTNNKNSFYNSINSALKGIINVFNSERNFRFQSLFALFIIILALALHVTRNEMILLLILIFSVLIMEMCNTVVEKLSDLLKPRLHSYVKDVKNMMAGAVLLTSLLSVIIGLYIFIPYIADLLY